MSTVLRGHVIDGAGNGVGNCRVDAVFLQRVQVGVPAAIGNRRDGNGPDDHDGRNDERDTAVTTTDGTRPVVEAAGRATASTNGDGRFTLTLPSSESVIGGVVTLTVAGPSGATLASTEVALRDSVDDVQITVVAPQAVAVAPGAEPTKTTQRISGLVVDTAGRRTAANLQVILYGVAAGSGGDMQAVGVATTDGRGHFSTDWPNAVFEAASARVASVEATVPIPLEDRRLPLRMLLVVDLPDPSSMANSDCHCQDSAVPRTPEPSDLATSSDYSTDLGIGGCIRFNVPNRSIEEFDFYNVVRTTEPEIRGVTVGTTTGAVPDRRFQLITALTRLTTAELKFGLVDNDLLEQMLVLLGIDSESLRQLVSGDLTVDVVEQLLQLELLDELLAESATSRAPGRAALDAANPVDWDSSPTFYEAATIAHGHLLHVKQIWYADGYSLGDLLYSLPLAPGQKKLVAVIDWERRERATRDDETLASESVLARLSRERDLSEVVAGALSESIRGGSRSTTAGAGVGTGGAGNGSYYGFNFGALMGVSGGYGEADSSAWQDSARTIGSSSLQSLRDLTLQSASAVRGQRTSVITTASQGEAVRATTEVVANHNHCHAMTVQYFEVLRHLKIAHELVDVQECLFVPLPMSTFDRPKVLRWRQSIDAYLLRPELRAALDATRRVETNWADSSTPAATYADELVTSIRGELLLTLLVPLPPFPVVPPTVTDPAKIAEIMAPTTGALGIALAVASGGLSLLVGAGAQQAAAGAGVLMETLASLPTDLDRYERFQHDVMPGVAVGFVDGLELSAQIGTSLVKLSGADFTLVSDYKPGTPMLVSVRGTLATPVTRASISNVVITSSQGLPTDCRAIINTAAIRYRTSTFEHSLVFEERVNDDIDLPTVVIDTSKSPPTFQVTAPGQGALLYAPTDAWEQRSPRSEDRRLSAELLEHLDANLEHYHHAMWWTMDPNRRYMLLDGYVAPHADGRSVASVVDNNLLGIVGNALVLPVARGNHLDPRFAPTAEGEPLDLIAHYAPSTPIPPARVSLPTRGVFAEAVMGDCNACEQVDDTRLWRWDQATVDEPTSIEALSTSTRRAEPLDTNPTALPSPIVSIQNAPTAPDPAGVRAVTDALGRPFADAMGLAGTQTNAAAAYQQALSTAAQFGKEASTLAQQAAMLGSLDKSMDAIDKAETGGKITADDARRLRLSALEKVVGDGGANGSRPAEATEKLEAIRSAVDSGAITTTDGREISRRVVGALAGEGTTADAAARLLEQVPPEQVTSVASTSADGSTFVEISDTGGRAAPTQIRGLSGLGSARTEGTSATRSLINGATAVLDAVVKGVADWKDDPGKDINDSIKAALLAAAQDAVDKATDKLPFAKAFKIVVELELAFVEGVGAAMLEIGDTRRAQYERGELAGMDSSGHSDADIRALLNLTAWQANSANDVAEVVLAGVESMVRKAVDKGADWAASTATDALANMVKTLVTGWVESAAGRVLIGLGINEVVAGIPDARAKLQQEAFNTVLSWYIRQLDDAELRGKLKPLAERNGRTLETELLTAITSMLIDSNIKSAKQQVKARLIATGHELLETVKAGGVLVNSGAGVSVSPDGKSITLPADELAALESGREIDRRFDWAREFELTDQLEAAWHVAEAVAVADGRASQSRLYALAKREDKSAFYRTYEAYKDRVRQLLYGLFAIHRERPAGSGPSNYLILRCLHISDVTLWTRLEIYPGDSGAPRFRVPTGSL